MDKGKATSAFPRRVTRHFEALAASGSRVDPILLQFEPDPREQASQPERFVVDPTCDAAHLRAPGLVVKYPGRALLLTGGPCAIHCRFCFRRGLDGLGVAGQQALDEVAIDPSITEVILSGGDPLGLDDATLERLLCALARIPHVRRVRVHTRHPVAAPERVTPTLVRLLTATRLRCWVVVHLNHPAELAPEAVAALDRLSSQNIPLLAQTVLLRGVNDDAATLAELFEGLVDVGVKPYQLHQLDPVFGGAHFEVPQSDGRELVNEVRRRVSGLAMPTWVQDLPGRLCKTALGLLLPVLLAVGLAGCSCGAGDERRLEVSLSDVAAEDVRTPAPPLVLPNLAAVERVLAADLDGDGTQEVLAAGANELRWGSWPAGAPSPTWEGRWEGEGALQSWLAHDLDGDGRDEVVAAFGVGRGFASAKLQLVLVQSEDGATTVAPLWSRSGERNQVTALEPWPREGGGLDVYLAAFSSRFVVQGGVLSLDGSPPVWLPGHELRMGMVRAVADFDGDARPEVAIGRLYGDDKDTDGDLRLVDDDGAVLMVPTLRGVRAVGSADLDGDGRPELLFGDGWHKNYGKLGRYRPSVASLGDDGRWTVEVAEERSDQYAVERIGAAGDLLVAGGNREVRVYRRSEDGWQTVAGPEVTSLQGAWTVLNGELVLGGPRIRRVQLVAGVAGL